MTRNVLALTLFLFTFSFKSYCQTGGDSNEQQALQYVRSLYASGIAVQSGIYDGPFYTGYPHPIKEGTQFFLSDQPINAEVFYNGLLYKNIPIWYDLAKNKVVTQNYNSLLKISLHNDKIEYFSFPGHRFINIDTLEAQAIKLKPGFYDQIYNGGTELIIKRSKDYLQSTDQAGVWVSFSKLKNEMFLKKDNQYYPVSSQKSILEVLGKYEKEITAHLRQKNLKFRRSREESIVAILSYYDQLNKKI